MYFLDESIQPPKRIQVISGPQSNTLLVSWEQLAAINTTKGYRVLIDGRQVQDITNPLSKIELSILGYSIFDVGLDDHTVINLKTAYPGRYLTIRTLTDNGGESNDSNPIDLEDVLKKVQFIILFSRFYHFFIF